MQTLKDIFKKAAAEDDVPNEDFAMSIAEFTNMVVCSGVVDDNFSAREIGTIFNLSMMT